MQRGHAKSRLSFNYSGLGGSRRIGNLHPPVPNFEQLKPHFEKDEI